MSRASRGSLRGYFVRSTFERKKINNKRSALGADFDCFFFVVFAPTTQGTIREEIKANEKK